MKAIDGVGNLGIKKGIYVFNKSLKRCITKAKFHGR
jgi:hypothetical protein